MVNKSPKVFTKMKIEGNKFVKMAIKIAIEEERDNLNSR